MLKLIFVLFPAILLAGCMAAPQPIVDMTGVDPVKYSHDAAECQHYADTAFELGNAVTHCMEAKGYKILYGY